MIGSRSIYIYLYECVCVCVAIVYSMYLVANHTTDVAIYFVSMNVWNYLKDLSVIMLMPSL